MALIDWVQIRIVRWPLLWLDEVNVLLMKTVDCISGCVRRSPVLLQSQIVATTRRLNDRQQASFENMFTIIFTVYFGAWINEHKSSPIRDTTAATVSP